MIPKAHPTTMDWKISYYYHHSDGFRLEAGASAQTDFKVYLTVEYTKTTD